MASSIRFRGINLAGAEFGDSELPGSFNKDFTYPTKRSVQYFQSKGMNIVRLPFRWERLQTRLNGDFDTAELLRMIEFVEATTQKQVVVILDAHNYGKYYGEPIGSSAVPVSAFADFWQRLSSIFRANDLVWFGLMNEPDKDLKTDAWVSAAQAAVNVIRGSDASNRILLSGAGYSGAHSWSDHWYGRPNAEAMKEIVDPSDNMIYEVHQYYDSNFEGKSDRCSETDKAINGLRSFTNWLRQNGYKGFLGEFGCAQDGGCQAAVASTLGLLEDNADVWVGWTWWAAGPWWGNGEGAKYSIEPTGEQDKPQMAFLEPYLR